VGMVKPEGGEIRRGSLAVGQWCPDVKPRLIPAEPQGRATKGAKPRTGRWPGDGPISRPINRNAEDSAARRDRPRDANRSREGREAECQERRPRAKRSRGGNGET